MIHISYKFFYLLPVIILIIIPVFLRMIDPFVPLNLHSVFRYIGVILMLFGGSIFLVSHRLIYRRSQWRDKPSALPGEPHQLITSDLYQYIRNPILAAIGIILLGYFLSTGSILQLFWLIFVIVIGILIVKLVEEPRLERQFGDEYRQYKREVPAFFPKLRRK